LDASTRDLDTIQFCDEKFVTIPVQNLGCDTLFVDSLKLAGQGFTLISAPTLPLVLLPNTTRPLTIHFVPTVSGPSAATLALRADADSAPLRMINFRCFASPTDTVRIGAKALRLSVSPGDTTVLA